MFLNENKILTLMMIMKNKSHKSELLLGMKKNGFGKGKWNWFGGKVEKEEAIYKAAVREVKEECGLDIITAKFMGLITFEYEIDKKVPMHVHIFQTSEFKGNPIETEEMRPQWFNTDNIPYDEMWKDDQYWYPFLFQNKYFYGKFLFGDYEHIISHELYEISEQELSNLQKKIVNHYL